MIAKGPVIWRVKLWKRTQKGEGMLVLRHRSSYFKRRFLQFEEILGEEIAKIYDGFLSQVQRCSPKVRGVHDDHLLFPFNSFNSLEEMKKSAYLV